MLAPEHRITGPVYRFGPDPCPSCQRATRIVRGYEMFAHPRRSYGLTFETPTARWSWSTVFGQGMPLVDSATKEFLESTFSEAEFKSYFQPDAPSAFLPALFG